MKNYLYYVLGIMAFTHTILSMEIEEKEVTEQQIQPIAPAAVPGYLQCIGSYLRGTLSSTYSGSQYLVSRTWSGLGYLTNLSVSGGRYVLNVGYCIFEHYVASTQLRRLISHPDKYSPILSSVRACTSLNNKEQEFLVRRMARVKNALEGMLDKSVDPKYIPKIALCFSGGGYRAMLETLGWLTGAEKIGLLDSSVYMTGLSGSTWALNPWVASRLSLAAYKEQLLLKLSKTLMEHVKSMSTNDALEILVTLGKKYVDLQSIGPVDFFGALLAHMLLAGIVKNKQAFSLADLASVVKMGSYPLVISTASLGGTLNLKYKPTFEFSPFEIGSAEIAQGIFIPSWSLGRVFNNGTSQSIVPLDLFKYEKEALSTAAELLTKRLGAEQEAGQEAKKKAQAADYFGRQQSLGYLMGIWGSAFALNISDVLFELAKKFVPEDVCPAEGESASGQFKLLKSIFASLLAKTIESLRIGSFELKSIAPVARDIKRYIEEENYGAATIPNITHTMANQPLRESPYISLVDGGFDEIEGNRLNIAITPLLRKDRDLDVIIIGDSSAILEGAPALRAAEKRAKVLGVKFPKITYEGIDKKPISIFIDENDPSVPIIVYMPAIANPAYSDFNPITALYTHTLNFTYTPEQAQTLMGLTEFNITQAAPAIREVVSKALDRKQAKEQKGEWFSWWRS